MKDRKFSKLMTILINVFTLCFCINNMAYATDGMGTVNAIMENILKILLGLGGAICVAKLIQIGIMYMTSSAVEKSNAKAAVLPWIVGTVVCFGAGWIGPMIINLFKIKGGVLDID